jgi:hypothetical protein
MCRCCRLGYHRRVAVIISWPFELSFIFCGRDFCEGFFARDLRFSILLAFTLWTVSTAKNVQVLTGLMPPFFVSPLLVDSSFFKCVIEHQKCRPWPWLWPRMARAQVCQFPDFKFVLPPCYHEQRNGDSTAVHSYSYRCEYTDH